jgi:serine/threonine protein kinase
VKLENPWYPRGVTVRAERTITSAAPVAPSGLPSLSPGARLGKYVLVTPLASGGMGQVFVGTADDAPWTAYAIKTVRADLASDPHFRSLFLREATLASIIRHPNVVEVIECGEANGYLYEVMPLIEGESLHGLSERHESAHGSRELPVGLVVRVAIDALRGLHAAHETRGDDGDLLGIVHRDVSPQNILVDVNGCGKLTDFGIAKALYVTTDVTETGDMKGKTAYLSPEQVSAHPIDRRSDLFSMGVVLWEALTGKRLFRDANPFETMRKIREFEVPDLRTLRVECPESLAAVVAMALQRRPDRRYPSARRMADALEEVALELQDEATRERTAQHVASLLGASLERRREAWAARDVATMAHIAAPVRRRSRGRWFAAGAVAAAGVAAVVYVTRKAPEVAMPAPEPPPPVVTVAVNEEPPPAVTSTASATTPAPRVPVAHARPRPAAVKVHVRESPPPPEPKEESPAKRSLPFDKNVYQP